MKTLRMNNLLFLKKKIDVYLDGECASEVLEYVTVKNFPNRKIYIYVYIYLYLYLYLCLYLYIFIYLWCIRKRLFKHQTGAEERHKTKIIKGVGSIANI